MKGYIKITAEPAEGGNITATEVDLQDISLADKACLLNAFLKGLQISVTEASVHLLAIRGGLINSEERKEEGSNERIQ